MEWGTRSSGVGFFCFHALGNTKQKKLTPLDRGPPLHVNRVLVCMFCFPNSDHINQSINQSKHLFHYSKHTQQKLISWLGVGKLALQTNRSSISGSHAISGDTNSNGEMNKCWWTNKAR